MERIETLVQGLKIVRSPFGADCTGVCQVLVVSGLVVALIVVSMLAVWLVRHKKAQRHVTGTPSPRNDSAAVQAEPIETEVVEPVEEIDETLVSQHAPQVAPVDAVATGTREEPPEAVYEPVKEPEETLLDRVRSRLSKTQEMLVGRLERLALRRGTIDRDVYEELEEILMTADMGVKTSYYLLAQLQQEIERKTVKTIDALKGILKEQIYAIFDAAVAPAEVDVDRATPFVIMVVGVNGVGKTTTIGKLAAKLSNGRRRIMLVAADTFRAAAIEQLEIWSQRVGADFIAQRPGSDPSAVAYDALHAARARGTDVVIVDTAGRLHTKTNLMEELKKVKRIIARELPGAPHEVFLVLDATTGQNAILQARTFHEALNVTGLVLTKLDGTAKGGVIVGIVHELKLPVRYIGIGEAMDDLTEFDPAVFLNALF